MKARRIDFALETGLVVCLRDNIDDELQVSFEEPLSLQLILFLIRVLLDVSFLK